MISLKRSLKKSCSIRSKVKLKISSEHKKRIHNFLPSSFLNEKQLACCRYADCVSEHMQKDVLSFF